MEMIDRHRQVEPGSRHGSLSFQQLIHSRRSTAAIVADLAAQSRDMREVLEGIDRTPSQLDDHTTRRAMNFQSVGVALR